jgi:hypothetical protein
MTIGETVEKNHKPIIIVLMLVIAVFLLACTFHDILPICHYIFGCDHKMHTAATVAANI